MKNWSRLILPLGLALLATIINASAMTNRLEVVELVAVNCDLAPGEEFKAEYLEKVSVSYPAAHLRNHFWKWDEREILLSKVGTPTRLKAGDLVPRNEYRDYGNSEILIAPGFMLIAVRFPESVLRSDERHLLLPGRDARVIFDDHDDKTVVKPRTVQIAFLEPVAETELAGTEKEYQMGFFVNRSRTEEVESFIYSRINRVVGLSGQPTR
jgi:hypothetical protein